MSPPNDTAWQSLRKKFIVKSLLITLPGLLVGPYLVGIILELKGNELWIALGPILLPIVGLVVVFQQGFVAGRLCRAALARNPNDAPGARLARLLALPRRLELYSLTLCYVVGAPLFTLVCCVVFGRPGYLVPVGMVVGIALAAIVGIPTTLLFQRDVLPYALEEFHQNPKVRPLESGGFHWPRQSWYLPYAFSVMLLSLFVSGAIVLTKAFSRAREALSAQLSASAGEQAAQAILDTASQAAMSVAVPMVVICGVILGFFIASGILMARREQSAAHAITRSLRDLAEGSPTPPSWVATDEIGDLAFDLAGVTYDMSSVFEQLKVIAAGNLSVELQGESGLVSTFRESQRTLLILSQQMRVLSHGNFLEDSSIEGDLGEAFGQLSAALGATIRHAKTIARGDLRQDMEVSGELGHAIHQMTHNLRMMVGQTQEVGNQIGDIVVSLRAATAQLSAATTEQVSALTETANTMTEMSQTSAASADRCAELIKQGNAATDVVEEGRNGAQEAGQAINAISSSLAKVSNASGVLAEKVQRVDSIIETVGFLADQSSTLAINASIEASRAGEAGRGFAAVAREMRTLASDSRKATAQIREILQEIRQKTVHVDTVVASGSSTVEEGVRMVNRLGEVITQLGLTIHDAVGLMRQVEGSARQHQAGVSQVSQALRSMQSAAESIRDGAHMLNALSEQEHQLASKLKGTANAYQLPANNAEPTA